MDIGLENYWRINKTKGYNRIFKMAVSGAENRLPAVSGVNPDSMEGIPQVNFRKILHLAELIHKILYKG